MSQVTKIQTTLYDLMVALQAELSPDEDSLVIATVVHLLQTQQVTCTGALQGYRLACTGRTHLAQLPLSNYGCFSQFESLANHCERPRKAIP